MSSFFCTVDRVVSTVLLLTLARSVPASTSSPCSTKISSTLTVEGTERSSTFSLTRVPVPDTAVSMEPTVTEAVLTFEELWAVTLRCTRCRTYSTAHSSTSSTTAITATTRLRVCFRFWAWFVFAIGGYLHFLTIRGPIV